MRAKQVLEDKNDKIMAEKRLIQEREKMEREKLDRNSD